jgi:hypothetical protein
MSQIEVIKRQHNVLYLNFGRDVSQDTFVATIRSEKDRNSKPLATWDVSFAFYGADVELVLTLYNSSTIGINEKNGYLFCEQLVNGESKLVFDEPIEVLFKEVV